MVGFVRRLAMAIASLALLATGVAAPVRGAVGATGINLTLPTGYIVSGHVLDAESHPVTGITVGICSGDPGFCSGTVSTAADGSFAVPGAQSGTYFAMVAGDPTLNFVNTWYDGSGGTTDPGSAVAFDVSGDTAGIDIVVATGFTLSGTLTDPHGNPAEGIAVEVGGPAAADTTTDASGHYEVGGLVQGSYSVFVRPPEGSPYTAGSIDSGAIVESFESSVSVSGDTTGVDAQLITGRSISGNLSGLSRPASVATSGSISDSDHPIASNGNFSITGLWPDQPVELIFNEAGGPCSGCQFPLGVYDGTSTLTIDQSAATQVDVSSGDVSGLDVAVPVTPSISGHITGQDGITPVGQVSLCGNSGCASSNIGADGSYALWNLPNDSFTLYISVSDHIGGFLTSSGGVDPNFANAAQIVVSGSDQTIDVTLPTGYSVSGRISGPSSEPVEGASVSIFSPTTNFAHSATTDANGDYTVMGLPAGDYQVYVSGPENGNYFSGYWSLSGYTSDYSSAGILHIPQGLPTILSSVPADGATSVARDGHLSITFSGSVSHVSGSTVSLHQLGSTKAIQAKVTYSDATHTVTIRTESSLKAKTTYVIEINGLTAPDGTPMPSTSITFTTGK